MQQSQQIIPGVDWVGVRHPDLKIFDELFPTHNGTTYNAYLVRGRDKTALIDTVKEPFTEELLAKLAGSRRSRPDRPGGRSTTPSPTIRGRCATCWPGARTCRSTAPRRPRTSSASCSTRRSMPRWSATARSSTSAAAPCASCWPPTCTGRTPCSPTWSKTACSSRATPSAPTTARSQLFDDEIPDFLQGFPLLLRLHHASLQGQGARGGGQGRGTPNCG